MARPALIALDWGASSLRAYLMDGAGAVLETRRRPGGILTVPDGDFEAAFMAAIGDWRAAHGPLPAVMSGMIGSRQGWREADYLPCPADGDALCARLLRFTTADGCATAIAPGMSVDEPGDAPDVMRGEETQVLGAFDDPPAPGAAAFVLPGTHSKWVLTQGGRVIWFATFMTGEAFAALSQHTILARLMEGEADDAAAFGRGVDAGLDQNAAHGGLLRRMFAVRALGLFERLAPGQAHAYLSGLLIGAELREAADALAARGVEPERVALIGDGALATRYGRALDRAGIDWTAAPADAAARGLHRIARAAGLVHHGG